MNTLHTFRFLLWLFGTLAALAVSLLCALPASDGKISALALVPFVWTVALLAGALHYFPTQWAQQLLATWTPSTLRSLDPIESALGQKRTSASLLRHVRFAPESGHPRDGGQCQLGARSRHCDRPREVKVSESARAISTYIFMASWKRNA